MADNDYNIIKPVAGIKPVDGLQNIAGLTAAKRREERKRRRNLPGGQQENAKGQLKDLVDQQKRDAESTDGQNNHHSIDYCA